MPQGDVAGFAEKIASFTLEKLTKEEIKKLLKGMTLADFPMLFRVLAEAKKMVQEKYQAEVKENCLTAEGDPGLAEFCDNNVAGASLGLGKELAAITKTEEILAEIKKERPLKAAEREKVHDAIYRAMNDDDRDPHEVVDDLFKGDWNEYYIVMANWHGVELDPLF